jgi:hypothetical protein
MQGQRLFALCYFRVSSAEVPALCPCAAAPFTTPFSPQPPYHALSPVLDATFLPHHLSGIVSRCHEKGAGALCKLFPCLRTRACGVRCCVRMDILQKQCLEKLDMSTPVVEEK